MNKSLNNTCPTESKLPYRFMKYRIHKNPARMLQLRRVHPEEDGHIESQIKPESTSTSTCRTRLVSRVSSTREALSCSAATTPYDFILTMYNVGELDVFSFAKTAA